MLPVIWYAAFDAPLGTPVGGVEVPRAVTPIGGVDAPRAVTPVGGVDVRAPVGVVVRAATGTPELGVRDDVGSDVGVLNEGGAVTGIPEDAGCGVEGLMGSPDDDGRDGGALTIADDDARIGGSVDGRDGAVISADEIRFGGDPVIGTPDGGVRVPAIETPEPAGTPVAGVVLKRVVGGSSEPVGDGGARSDCGTEMRSAASLPRRTTSTIKRRPHASTSTPACESLRSIIAPSGVPCSNVAIWARDTGCALTTRNSPPTRIAIGRSTPITTSLTSGWSR
jgi:hypothetical protein